MTIKQLTAQFSHDYYEGHSGTYTIWFKSLSDAKNAIKHIYKTNKSLYYCIGSRTKGIKANGTEFKFTHKMEDMIHFRWEEEKWKHYFITIRSFELYDNY